MQDPDLRDSRNITSGGLNTLQRQPRRLLGLAGRRRDLRKTMDDIQDDRHARRHAPQCTCYSIQPLHPRDSGGDDDFHTPLLMYPAPPCDYKRRRWVSFKGGRSGLQQSRSPALTIIVTSKPCWALTVTDSPSGRDLGASLPLSPRLYPLLQALRVQDNTVPSHNPFAGRTAPRPEPG